MTEIISLVNNCISEYFSVNKSCLYNKSTNKDISKARSFCWLILHDIYGISYNQLSKEYNSFYTNIQQRIYQYRDYIKIYPEYYKIFDEIKLLLDSRLN